MPSDWEETTLQEAVEINPPRMLAKGATAPYIAMESLIPFQRRAEGIMPKVFAGSGSRFRNGDTLLARITPCLENGKTAFISELPNDVIGHGSTEFIVLSGKEGRSDNLFIYYLARDPAFRTFAIQLMEGSSGRQRVPASALGRLRVELPPPAEQRAIAAILGALDDKIELNRHMNETLEAMARALFKSWFVDFDPFRDQGMQDSPLGPIPKGWQCIVVAEALDINPPRRLERGANAVYVDMSALPTASARVLETIRRPFSGSGSRFANGDVLLARITPCLENGKTAIVDFLQDEEIGWGSTEFIVLGPKPPLGMPFNYCLARHPDFRAHAIQAMTGTSGRQRVDPGCFDHYWLTVPPAPIAQEFQEKVGPWFQKMKANDDESHALASIRDALLPKLLSGDIRVKDAERFLQERGL